MRLEWETLCMNTKYHKWNVLRINDWNIFDMALRKIDVVNLNDDPTKLKNTISQRVNKTLATITFRNLRENPKRTKINGNVKMRLCFVNALTFVLRNFNSNSGNVECCISSCLKS